jgi:hypothetical protein
VDFHGGSFLVAGHSRRVASLSGGVVDHRGGATSGVVAQYHEWYQ